MCHWNWNWFPSCDACESQNLIIIWISNDQARRTHDVHSKSLFNWQLFVRELYVRITLNVMKSHELMETVEDRKLSTNSEVRGRKIQKSRGAEKVNYNIIFD